MDLNAHECVQTVSNMSKTSEKLSLFKRKIFGKEMATNYERLLHLEENCEKKLKTVHKTVGRKAIRKNRKKEDHLCTFIHSVHF